MSEQYSPEVQAYLNQRKQEVSTIPELPLSYIRLNGKTGEWQETVPDPDNEGKKKRVPMAKADGTAIGESFGGVILRVAYFSEYKGHWISDSKGGMKNDSKIRRRTREFTDFREKIELLDFSDEKSKTLRTFQSYQDFKEYATPKDAEGNKGVSMYSLKSALYVLQLSTSKLYKLVVSGSGVSEVFGYQSNKKDENTHSLPWRLAFPNAVDITQIKTAFKRTEGTAPNGGTYYSMTFFPQGICGNKDMQKVIEGNAKLQEWVDAWAALYTSKNEELQIEERLATASMVANETVETSYVSDAVPPPTDADIPPEIKIEDIPF